MGHLDGPAVVPDISQLVPLELLLESHCPLLVEADPWLVSRCQRHPRQRSPGAPPPRSLRTLVPDAAVEAAEEEAANRKGQHDANCLVLVCTLSENEMRLQKKTIASIASQTKTKI